MPTQPCGWQKKCWMDNVEEWTCLPQSELLTMTSCRDSTDLNNHAGFVSGQREKGFKIEKVCLESY